MPQQAWSAERERQYEHIKDQQKERGASESRAEEIAARVVNKNRAQSGESQPKTPIHSPTMLPTTTRTSAPSSAYASHCWPRGSRPAIMGARKMPAARNAVDTQKMDNWTCQVRVRL